MLFQVSLLILLRTLSGLGVVILGGLAHAVEEGAIARDLCLDLRLVKLTHGEEVLHEFADQLPEALLHRVIYALQ